MIDFEPNCVGYALHCFKLGETEETQEKYVDPQDVIWTDFFSEVKSAKQADAVLVIYTVDHDEAELEHIAVFDPADKGIIRHRRSYGTKVTTDTLDNLISKFSKPIFDIIYVKLKT